MRTKEKGRISGERGKNFLGNRNCMCKGPEVRRDLED